MEVQREDGVTKRKQTLLRDAGANGSAKRRLCYKKTQTLLRAKKFGTLLDLCVSSLRRGHANLLCIVPILSYVTGVTPDRNQSDHEVSYVLERCESKYIIY